MTTAARLVARLVAIFARLVTGVTAEWRGCRPEARQRVYFANHSSHGDFVLIWTVLPENLRRSTRPVAAADYWGAGGVTGFIGADVFAAVLIDRQGGASSHNPLEPLAAALAAGDSLIFFPEGTRNTTDEPLLPLRSGLYRLAQSFPQVEFTPVWIENISRVMPKGEFLPIPLLCRVIFGAPLALAPGEDKPTFLERARLSLLALRPGAPP